MDRRNTHFLKIQCVPVAAAVAVNFGLTRSIIRTMYYLIVVYYQDGIILIIFITLTVGSSGLAWLGVREIGDKIINEVNGPKSRALS